jgi:HK97 family phage portal protein
VIIRNRFGSNVELRTSGEFGSSKIPAPWSGAISAAGVPVTQTEAYGLPAISNVIRSPAEIIAALPFLVYRRGDVRERAEASWQWQLLHERPSEECDTFEFFYDLALSLEATQNTFLQKAKSGQRVFELYVLDPQRVTVRRDKDTGEKLFDVYVSSSDVRRNLTTEEILHIRGFTPQPGGATGVSLLQANKDPVGAAIAMQRFEGDYFRNSGMSPFFFELGQGGNASQAQEMIDSYHAQHAKFGNRFRVSAVWGGTTVKPVPISMADAAFAETKKLSIEDACRIWRWPKELLELRGEEGPSDENAWSSRFLKFYLLPRLRRIERAFAADSDLFFGSNLVGEFLTAALERADFVSRIRAYKDAIQGGHMTPNETRQPENLPPHPDGDSLQFPVVGGGPLKSASANGVGSDEEAEEALSSLS